MAAFVGSIPKTLKKHLRKGGYTRIIKAGYRYGEGFSIDDIKEETIKAIVNMPGFQLHETMYYLHHKGYVKTQAMWLIGYQPDPHLVPYWEVK